MLASALRPSLSSRLFALCSLFVGLQTAHAGDARAALRPQSNQVIGAWRIHRYGDHLLTTNPDGTAAMQMKLNRIGAMFYGREMRLDLRWNIEDGLLKQRIVGGAPESAVAKLIQDYGDSHDYRILEMERDHLLVEDVAKPGTTIRWEAGGGM